MQRRDLLVLVGGAAVMAPLAVRAQQKAMPVIGMLNPLSPGPVVERYLAAFRQGLAEAGYIEGLTVAIEYRWAEGRADRLPRLAADLVEGKVDVIAASAGIAAALAAKNATTTIPIIFAVAVDPVKMGLVASLSHPGGNLTGFSFLNTELTSKRFELLSELLRQVATIAILVNPKNPGAESSVRDIQEMARAKGMRVLVLKVARDSEIDPAFASYAQSGADALIILNDPLFFRRAEQLAMLASHQAIPAIASWREFADAGGLVTYGTNIADVIRRQGAYVGRVLKGEKPADLPVQQPTKLELVINMKAAKALGLAIPQSIVVRADDVIE
jgi:putative tryptophan/tyrosine transport system substrate-binding protein